MTIADIIKNRRQEVGMTQQQLGEACGYAGRAAEVSVQCWEHGRRPVPLNKMRILADALKIPVEALIP